ncbi:cupin domain-containing protein [Ruegeria hyattellae]|uniref:cupin domain-containing protein n=1 Tax=Ruegeria hyattellae TaxID=3233337 RepID=UPI00355BCE84
MSDRETKSNGAQSSDAALRYLGLDDADNAQDAPTESEILAWADRFLAFETDEAPPPPASLWESIAQQVAVAPGIRTVHPGDGVWETLGDGLRRKIVHIDPDTGCASYFLELAAGSQLPAHEHPVDEHCAVLEGTLRIRSQVFGAGAYQFSKSGHPHPPITAETRALVFIYGPT